MLPNIRRFAPTLPAVALIVASAVAFLVSCEKNAEEAEKFPRAEEHAPLAPGELTSFQLANGVTVYLQEERSRPEVAVEVLYGGGVLDERAGKSQSSRILPHMMIFSPTASFGPDEAVDQIQKIGRVNGEVASEFAHFDYIASGNQLELVLKVEAERITSVKFNDDQLEKYAKKCADDIDTLLKGPRRSLTKYGLMAFNQAYNFGKTSIPIHDGVYNVTIDDIERFRQTNYRLESMVLVVIGDFDTAEATALIKKYFESIPEWPVVSEPSTRPTEGNLSARWDIDSNAMFLVFPGPYENEAARLTLTIFGTLLNHELMTNVELPVFAKSAFCSNQTLLVGEMPFFIFVEAMRGRALQDVRSAILQVVDAAMRRVTEKMWGTMKSSLVNFLESSILESQLSAPNTPHYQVLGQAALDVGVKHHIRDGRSEEEFVEFVRAISFEDAKRYIESALTVESARAVTILGRDDE